LASIRGSLAADKIVPRGVGVPLSSAPLLTEPSLRGAKLSGTSLSGTLMLTDSSLHGGTLGLADASLCGALALACFSL
jgi:hypothetical protein